MVTVIHSNCNPWGKKNSKCIAAIFLEKMGIWQCRICICNKFWNFKYSEKVIRGKCLHFLWVWLIRDMFDMVNIHCFLPAWNILSENTILLHLGDLWPWCVFVWSPVSLVRVNCVFLVCARGKCCLNTIRPDSLPVLCLYSPPCQVEIGTLKAHVNPRAWN